ncbi:MAG: cryptochrome/photolyase family protein [Pseudomonadota bacterium]
MTQPRIVLVLGDQLSLNLSSLSAADPARDIVLMAEVADEASYVRHHKKKLAFVFSAMRHHARALRAEGWQVEYVTLEEPENSGSLGGELRRAIQRTKAGGAVLTAPGEWRLAEEAQSWSETLGVPVEILPDDRFLASPEDFAKWAEGRKQLRMEYFYRDMRRKTGLLMEGDQPAGEQWNFDSENRKPARGDLSIPEPLKIAPDAITRDVLEMVGTNFPDHFGSLDPFWYAVTREDALAALDTFVDKALPNFGDYQDAMLEGEKFLYHSVLAQYLNIGLLGPLEICSAVERAYHDGHAPLNAVEGYIRQVIGWREYVRGIYWLKMPGYTQSNFFEAERPLPAFYWSGKTDMACVSAAVAQTRDEAYAHHIQRLMVTGNFALLAGLDPHQVHEWYLSVYSDAYEWVEAPNTIGMALFADGGLLGSKPYAASGNYINKMSDHCRGCRYDVKVKTGEGACPFNPLYWDFLLRNRQKLGKNPRLAQVYRTWDRMGEDKKQAYRASAETLLADLDAL